MREKHIEDDCVAMAEADGWLVRKVLYAGIKGSPDRWFFKNGVLLCVEFKKPGEEPNGQQLKQQAKLNDHGFYVHNINNKKDFETLMWKYNTFFANNKFKQPVIRL